MCKFFSVISNGKGKVLFFTVEQVATIMSENNPEQLEFNSHSSIAEFNNVKEDRWNKYEYDIDKKELVIDMLNTKDDSKSVTKTVEAYLKDKNVVFLRNNTNHEVKED